MIQAGRFWLRIATSSEHGKELKHLQQFFYVLPGGHLSINLVNDQLDAQFFYFLIRLLQSSTCFEQRRAHHQEVKLY